MQTVYEIIQPQAKEDNDPKTVINAERLQVPLTDKSMKVSLQISPSVKIMSLILIQTIMRVEKVRKFLLKMQIHITIKEKTIDTLPTPRITQGYPFPEECIVQPMESAMLKRGYGMLLEKIVMVFRSIKKIKIFCCFEGIPLFDWNQAIDCQVACQLINWLSFLNG